MCLNIEKWSRVAESNQLRSSLSVFKSLSLFVDDACNADTICVAFLASNSLEKALHHEVEPENVKSGQPNEEGSQHANVGKVCFLASVLFVTFFIDSLDNIAWEVPKSEVHPDH